MKMKNKANESLPNLHAIYCGVSGSGKTQAMAQNQVLKGKNVRALLWDTHQSFKAEHYNNIPSLIKALRAAEKRKGGYRIAYNGIKTPEAFEKLCELVLSEEWLNADKQNVFVVDELASVSSAIGKDTSNFGDILRETRKFNIVVLCSATSAAEIPKTAFKNCMTKVIGAQGSKSDAQTMADLLLIKPELLYDTELEPLTFWLKLPGKPAVKYDVKYKKPPL